MKIVQAVVYVLVAGLFSLNLRAEDKKMNSTNQTEIAVFGGGCYWCTEAIYQMLPGVKSVTSGFAGGTKENPTYEEVSTGRTGHAEVIQIEYDPKAVTYEKLLDTFRADNRAAVRLIRMRAEIILVIILGFPKFL